MKSFILKIIAVTTMLIDHSGYLIFNGFSFMNYIGRLAFPIFAFLTLLLFKIIIYFCNNQINILHA